MNVRSVSTPLRIVRGPGRLRRPGRPRGPGGLRGPLAARALLLVALTLAAGLPVHADMEDVEIGSQPLADGLWMLTGRGGNLIASVGADGILLVDDQFAPLTEKIRAELDALGGGEVRFVLNTHFHGDHTGGNENFAEMGGILVAHENVRARMQVETFHPLRGTNRPPAPEGNWPVVTFQEDVTFWFNDLEVRVFHVDPAHTDGDAVVHFPDVNVIHLGDILFSDYYPFIDSGVDGSLEGCVAAVDRILPLIDEKTQIVCGHGAPTDRDGLIAYRDMLTAIGARIREAVASGKTLEETQAMKPTADYDPEWGDGFLDPDTFVKLVYSMMSK